MPVLYLDASALIKRYVLEAGSIWMAAFAFDSPDAVLITSRLTMVEARSALARRRREANISAQDHADAIAALNEDSFVLYRFIELEAPVIALAGELLDRHPLRTNDAIQLASALLANRALVNAGLEALTFLSADDRLLAIARAEKLAVDNPNSH